MTNEFNKKEHDAACGESLAELLQDVTDAQERERLTKAWHALGGLSDVQCRTPKPSRELENIFRGVNEEMADDELEMLAAAGIPGQQYTGDDNPNYFPGTVGDDTVEGEGGNDILRGNAGDDIIDGGAGNDRLYGDAGNDRIIGGEGNDILIGGTGGDVFVFDGSSGDDTIADFNPLEDSLEFNGVDPSDITTRFDESTGNTIITFGENSITIAGVNLLEDTSGSKW